MSLPRLFSQWAVLLAPLALVAAGASTAWAQAASPVTPVPAVTPMPAPAMLPPVPAAARLRRRRLRHRDLWGDQLRRRLRRVPEA